MDSNTENAWKYPTEEYSKLLNGRLPCSDLEIELCDRLLDGQKIIDMTSLKIKL